MHKFFDKTNIILLSLALLCVLGLIITDRSNRRKEIYDTLYIDFKDLNVEYGSNINVYDLVDKYNGQIFIDSDIDTSKVGDYVLSCKVSQREDRYNQIVERKYEETVKVVDRKKPIIELENDTVYVYVNSDYDLRNNVLRVYDEVDGDISDYEIKGDIDFTSRGEYQVEVIASDKNGLSNSETYTLVVRNRSVSGGEGYNIIYNYLTNTYGYNKAAACGILANIRFESNFNPDIGDYYYGLCQWGGSRKDNLFSYCASNGLDATTIEGQLAFMNYELDGYYSGVKSYLYSIDNSASGAWNAGDYFCRYYEAAASADGRGDLASDYFSQ